MKKGYKVCPFCANEIKEGAVKCQYCHERLNEEEKIDGSKNSYRISNPTSKEFIKRGTSAETIESKAKKTNQEKTKGDSYSLKGEKRLHYDENKEYTLNDYIDLETLTLLTEGEFDELDYRQVYKYKKIGTCRKELVEKLYNYKLSKVKVSDSDKILSKLGKIDKDEYINVFDFSNIKKDAYSKLRIEDKLKYLEVIEFVKAFYLPNSRADLNEECKNLLKKKFWIGRISRILSFIFPGFYLLYARRYNFFFFLFVLNLLAAFINSDAINIIAMLLNIVLRICLVMDLPRLCYNGSAPKMKKYLCENYQSRIGKE